VLFRSRIELCRDSTKSRVNKTFRKIGNPNSHHEGPHHQLLRANRDVLASQHVNSHSPSKESTIATSKIYFSLANCLLVTFTCLQYYSIYWFMTGTTWSLLHGPRFHSSSNAQITGLRLVLYVTEGASLLYFQYNSVY
jgi:hypothetical protein